MAVAFKRLAGAMEDAGGNESASAVQLADARWLLGDSAAKTIYAMQVRGELPMPGTKAWDDFLAAAAAGDVEIVTQVRVRERPAPPKPREPRSLVEDIRAMGFT